MEKDKKILFGKYEIGKLLGKGNFAKVYYAQHLVTNECVAIKVIKKDVVIKHQRMMDNILREISVMRLVRHPNIVELKEVMATQSKIFFVMEYVPGGDLFAKIKRGRLKKETARKYFQQLISAVDFCHSRGVFHRDIKPENLLLDENDDLKLSDFGLSALHEHSRKGVLLRTRCGTLCYTAPEVLRMKGYDGAKADTWSCGVVLYELLASFHPFKDENLWAMCVQIYKAEYECPTWFSTDSRLLISRILVPDPGRRISVEGIMQVSWFRKGFRKTHGFSIQESTFEKLDEEEKFIHNESIKKSPSSPAALNAFQLISSMTSGFDLSNIFEDKKQKVDDLFTSRSSAKVIIGKIETLAKRFGYKVATLKDFKLRMVGPLEGRKGRLSITAQVFKVAPEVTVVEISKFSGDTLEYIKFREKDMRPGLKDIVWTWQGDTIFEMGAGECSKMWNSNCFS